MMNTIEGGVTAAKDLWRRAQRQELNIKTVQIWYLSIQKARRSVQELYNECSKGSTGLVG